MANKKMREKPKTASYRRDKRPSACSRRALEQREHTLILHDLSVSGCRRRKMTNNPMKKHNNPAILCA